MSNITLEAYKQTNKQTKEKINFLAQGEQHHHGSSNNVDRVVGRRLPALQPLQGGCKFLAKDYIVAYHQTALVN